MGNSIAFRDIKSIKKREKELNRYLLVIKEEGNSKFFGYFPSVPGCFVQGKSLDKVIFNGKDALSLFISVKAIHKGEIVPIYRVK